MASPTNSVPNFPGENHVGSLVNFLLDYLNGGALGLRLLVLVLALLLANIPGIIAWFGEWRQKKHVKALYERMLEQNKAEIERQKDRIKELENLLLKAKRK